MAFEAYQSYYWWKKIVVERVITEEGVFAKDQVPPDYAGAELTVRVVQRLLVSEPGGNFIELRMDDVSDVMNSSRVKGCGASITWGDAPVEPVFAPTNGFTEEWLPITNSAMNPNEATTVAFMHSKFQSEGGR
jgi:hypothetical protein